MKGHILAKALTTDFPLPEARLEGADGLWPFWWRVTSLSPPAKCLSVWKGCKECGHWFTPPDFLKKSAFKNPILKSLSCYYPRNVCHLWITPTCFPFQLKKQVRFITAIVFLFLLSFSSSIWPGGSLLRQKKLPQDRLLEDGKQVTCALLLPRVKCHQRIKSQGLLRTADCTGIIFQ